MSPGENTNPPSGGTVPEGGMSSQGGHVEAVEAWDIAKGAKSLVDWIGKLRSRNKGDQSAGDGVLSDVLASSPGMRAVDVESSSRAIQDYLPQIRELADEMQTIGVQPYQSALDHANSPQGVVSVVTPEMERLEQVLGRVDASRAQLEQETRPVTDAIDTLVKFDELEAIMGRQEGRGAHAITDQYQARVSALIRATINNHQANVIRDTLEAGAPYPPAVPLTTHQVALKAISFMESVWQALSVKNEKEKEDVTSEKGETGRTPAEKKNIPQTPQQTSATKIEALVKALPISSAEQDKVRTELDFILAQYFQALQTDPVQALMSSTSVVPIVQERIEQSRSDIANIPAVIQVGQEITPLFSQLEELFKADPTVRARIANSAIERTSALLAALENPNGGVGSIGQNLQTIQTLLQEYAKPNLTRERANAIREDMRRIAEALAGGVEDQTVDLGDQHFSVLTTGLGQHIEENNDELRPSTRNKRERGFSRQRQNNSKGSNSVGEPPPATDGDSKDRAANEAPQVSPDTGERTAGLADFRVLRSAVLASESNIEGIRKLGFYTRDAGDATETVRMILEDENRTQRKQLELVREYIRSMYDRPSADAAIGAISRRGFEALCCEIAITTQYESTALSAALRLNTLIFIQVFFRHNGNPNAKSALIAKYLGNENSESDTVISTLFQEGLITGEALDLVNQIRPRIVEQHSTHSSSTSTLNDGEPQQIGVESQSAPEDLPIPDGYERMDTRQYREASVPLEQDREDIEVHNPNNSKEVCVKFGYHKCEDDPQRVRIWVFDLAHPADNASGGELAGDDAHTFVHGGYAVVGRVVEKDGQKVAQIELFRKSEESAQEEKTHQEEADSADGSPEPDVAGGGAPPEADPAVTTPQETEVSPKKLDEKVVVYAAPEIGTRPTDLEPFTPSFIICNDENTGFSQRDPPNEFTSGAFKIRVRNGTAQSNTGHVCVDILSNDQKYDVLAQQLISWTEGSTDLTDIRVEQALSPLVLWGKVRVIPGEPPRIAYILELCTKKESAPAEVTALSAHADHEEDQNRVEAPQFTPLTPTQIIEQFASAFSPTATPESIESAKRAYVTQLLAIRDNLSRESIANMFSVLQHSQPIVLETLVKIFQENREISEMMNTNPAVRAEVVQGMLQCIFALSKKFGNIVQLYEQVLPLAPTDVSTIPADLRGIYVFDCITMLDSIGDVSVPIARSLVLRMYAFVDQYKKRDFGQSIVNNLGSVHNMDRWSRFIPLSDDAQAETFLQLINDNSIVLGGDIRSGVNLILPERGYIANEAGVWRRAET